MRKALHDENDEFFTFREGKLSRFQTGDIDWLLAAANDAPTIEYRKNQGFTQVLRNGIPVATITLEENFCCWVNRYMSWLVEQGIVENLVNELNENLSEVRYIHILMLSKNKEPYWQNNIADMERQITPPELAAHSFASQLAAGGLNGLKRCELSDCKMFFVGRPNAKWCSKSCGGKHRIREKRKRDLD